MIIDHTYFTHTHNPPHCSFHPPLCEKWEAQPVHLCIHQLYLSLTPVCDAGGACLLFGSFNLPFQMLDQLVVVPPLFLSSVQCGWCVWGKTDRKWTTHFRCLLPGTCCRVSCDESRGGEGPVTAARRVGGPHQKKKKTKKTTAMLYI